MKEGFGDFSTSEPCLKCPYCGEVEVKSDYLVEGKRYPFIANLQGMNDAYAFCHYGVTTWWTEIHCCKNCKKEYYTEHEH